MRIKYPSLRLLAIGLSILVYLGCSAQRTYDPHVFIGAKGGATLSRVNFKPHIPQSLIVGKMVGVMVRYSEENHFGLIGEFNIEQRGWKEFFDKTPYRYEHQFTYFQLPILTNIFFGSKNFKGFFNIGPEFGFMLGEKVNTNFDTSAADKLPEFPVGHRTAQYNLKVSSKFDYGISAGFGMECGIGKRNSVAIEGRLYYGLGNVYPSHKTDYFSASSGLSIMATASYWFRLK